MKFKNVRGRTSFKQLYDIGIRSKDEVVVLFSNGDVKYGVVHFEDEYQTLFDATLLVEDGYSRKSIDLTSAVGISEVLWESDDET